MADETKPASTHTPLRPTDIANFDTLRRASRNGDLCLLQATRKSDGTPVALVCAMGREGKGSEFTYLPVPLAVMIEDDPFTIFEPLEGVDVVEPTGTGKEGAQP
jgi:hypothetical protein